MTDQGMAPEAVARELWSLAAAAGRPAAESADQLARALHAGLGRWIGAEGYRALLGRSLAEVRDHHPILDSLPSLAGPGPPADGHPPLADAPDAIAAGMIALMAALIVLLGRIIGEGMAVRMVQQVGRPSPRGIVSTRILGELDD